MTTQHADPTAIEFATLRHVLISVHAFYVNQEPELDNAGTGETDNPTIVILGTGALGAYYGGRLAQHGHDVHFHTRSDAAAIRARGLIVESVRGDFAIAADRVRVYDDVAAMPKADLVIVTLKCTARPHYRELLEPLVHDRTRVLCLQNGLGNEEAFAEIVGRERVMGGIAFVCINRVAPGHARHSSHGQIKLGEVRGAPDDPGHAKKVVEPVCVVERRR